MRLKRIRIERYGPVEDISLSIEKGIQPIYGTNESGKTLIVDYLIKKLAGKDVYSEKSLQRVTEKPEGFLVLDDEGNEIKLEDNETLSDYLPLNSDEIRNIFIMRDSDLKVTKEELFYERITDRLTGLRSDEIKNIIEKIVEFGQITGKNLDLADSAKHYYLKTKFENAKKLKDAIVGYINESKKEGIIDLEIKIFETEKMLVKKENELEKMKKAKIKYDFENLQKIVKKSGSLIGEIDKLPIKSEMESMSFELNQFLLKNPQSVNFSKISNFSKWNILASIPFLFIFWIIWAIKNISLLGLVSPIVLSTFLCVNITLWFYTFNKIKIYKNEERELLIKSKNFGFETKNINQLQRKIHGLNEMIDRKETKLKENLGIIKNSFKIKNDKAEIVITKADEKLKAQESDIDQSIKLKFNKKKYELTEVKISELQKHIVFLKEKGEFHKENLKDFSRKAHKLDMHIFIDEEIDFSIDTFESLDILIQKLEIFISSIDEKKNNCIQAIKIFKDLESEEKSKVSKLFDEKSKTARIFNEITDGRYISVHFDNESKKIITEKKDGEFLSADLLSKGAVDQLYLAIRIDLAQRLLTEKKGFFIMDDTFLSASRNRFDEGMKIFHNLIKSGWHIIYFTAKDSDFKKLCMIADTKGIVLEPLD